MLNNKKILRIPIKKLRVSIRQRQLRRITYRVLMYIKLSTNILVRDGHLIIRTAIANSNEPKHFERNSL